MKARSGSAGLSRWSVALASILVLGFGSLSSGPAMASEAEPQLLPSGGAKVVPSSRLLLPLYQIDTTGGAGATTLYALRNESLDPISVLISYYEVDSPQAAQRTDSMTLKGKEVLPINIRDVSDLEVDADNIARGYVIFEVMGAGASLSGDYFQVTPGDAFAVGERLVDVSGGQGNQLCSSFSTRFLNNSAFTGGTRINYWLDADSLPLDPNTFAYSVYDETGNLLFANTLPLLDVAGSIDVSQLFLGPFNPEAGALEIQLSETVGFVTATMSASNLFSVSMNALCRN